MTNSTRFDIENFQIGYRDGLIARKEVSAQQDALKLFHDDILTKKAREHNEPSEAGVGVGGSQEQSSNSDSLGSYTADVQSPEIKVQFFHQEVSTPYLC
ncbi:hypothetical protein CRYUN_Cryun11dG0079700 [Craigia yunnanensis]